MYSPQQSITYVYNISTICYLGLFATDIRKEMLIVMAFGGVHPYASYMRLPPDLTEPPIPNPSVYEDETRLQRTEHIR